jgi:hypothetical protein
MKSTKHVGKIKNTGSKVLIKTSLYNRNLIGLIGQLQRQNLFLIFYKITMALKSLISTPLSNRK